MFKGGLKITHDIAELNKKLLFSKSYNIAVRDNSMKFSDNKQSEGRLFIFPTTYCYIALFFVISNCRVESVRLIKNGLRKINEDVS